MRPTASLRAGIRRALICVARFTALRLLGPHADTFIVLAISQFDLARKKHVASQQ